MNQILNMSLVKTRLFTIRYEVNGSLGTRLYLHHLHFRNWTRQDARQLDALFPFTSTVDKNHMVTTCGYTMLQITSQSGSHLRKHALTRLLEMPLLTVPNQLVLGYVMISHCNPAVCHVFQEALENGILHADYETQRGYWKLVNTSSKTFFVTPYLKQLSPPDNFLVSYVDMAYGRSTMESNLQREYVNRTTHTYYQRFNKSHLLEDTWRKDTVGFHERDPEFQEQLKKALKILMRPLINKKHVQTGYQEFLERRSDWVTAGSAGGPNTKINSKISSCFSS